MARIKFGTHHGLRAKVASQSSNYLARRDCHCSRSDRVRRLNHTQTPPNTGHHSQNALRAALGSSCVAALGSRIQSWLTLFRNSHTHTTAHDEVKTEHSLRRRHSTLLTLSIAVSLVSLTANGQAQSILVSNLSQSTNATAMVDDERLQAFTTGSYTTGYELTHIDLDIVLPTPVDSFTVNVWTMRENRPGNRIATLRTSAVVVGELTRFVPPNPIVLTPNTQYFLHISVTDPQARLILKATKSGSEDRSSAATEWRIANRSIHVPELGTNAWVSEDNVIKVGIYGHERDITPPQLRGATLDRTSLTLSYHEALDASAEISPSLFTAS